VNYPRIIFQDSIESKEYRVIVRLSEENALSFAYEESAGINQMDRSQWKKVSLLEILAPDSKYDFERMHLIMGAILGAVQDYDRIKDAFIVE